MNVREAAQILVKSLKDMKESLDKEQLQKGLLGASAPGAPKSAVMGKDKSKMAGVGAAPKSPAAAFGGKNDLNKPAAPVAKSDDLEKSGVVVIEGSKKVAKKDSMMKMVGYLKGKK